MVGNVKFVWNIPNALSIFRLVLLPVFAVLILVVERDAELPLWSFGVLVLSGVTDSLDGIIARRFHQITDFGKLMDPVADKITQVTVVICLAVRYTVLIPLVVICLVKELIQAVGRVYPAAQGGENPGGPDGSARFRPSYSTGRWR